MQPEIASQDTEETVALYRTRWLMAHNRLHEAAHDHPELLKTYWDDYLRDLDSADAVAKQAA